MIRVLSMNFDGTYSIRAVASMNQADELAMRHVNQLHFIQHRTHSGVVQWVGSYVDTMSWYTPINPEQAKKAQLLFMLEPQ